MKIGEYNVQNIDDFHRYVIDFKPINGNEMTLYLTSDDEIFINITGSIKNRIDTYLCDKSEFDDYIEFKDKKMYIEGTECAILDVDLETNQEFNDWCERIEMEEWID